MNPAPRFLPSTDNLINVAFTGRCVGNDTPPARATRALRVAVVYDDSAASRRALGVLDRLERDSAGAIQVHPVLWRFDRLALVLDRCRAADDLADADVIVLSLTDSESMPAPIEKWFDYCLAQKHGTATLLLLHRDEEAWVVAESKTAVPLHAA